MTVSLYRAVPAAELADFLIWRISALKAAGLLGPELDGVDPPQLLGARNGAAKTQLR